MVYAASIEGTLVPKNCRPSKKGGMAQVVQWSNGNTPMLQTPRTVLFLYASHCDNSVAS